MVDVEQERERLTGELSDVESQIERLTNLLDGPFSEKAPEDVVQKERDKLARYRAEREELRERLETLA
ncbi:MAG: hypothetical protein R3248_15300 [Candidatus Promineifilaceae bacterium]|nr:hypothetical protein [Candidatus Promineifilaceae bacterium]